MGRAQDRFANLLRGIAERIDERHGGIDLLIEDLDLDIDFPWCPCCEPDSGEAPERPSVADHRGAADSGARRPDNDWMDWYRDGGIGSSLPYAVGRAMWDDVHEAGMMHAVTLTRIARRYGFGTEDG